MQNSKLETQSHLLCYLHGEELLAKLLRRKSSVATHCQMQNSDTAAFQMQFPSGKGLRRGIYYMQAFMYSQTQLELQKRKKTKRKQEKMVGEGDRKQERARNKCKDVFRLFSCPCITQWTIRYTAWSFLKCSILITPFCKECSR